jgi:hypothetical protein
MGYTIALLLVLGIGHARADGTPADPACEKPAELVAEVASSAPPFLAVEQIADITGPGVAQIVERFNSLPPVSDYQADEAVIIHALVRTTGEEHPKWVVALFFHGCKQAAAAVPSAAFRPLVGSGA